MNHETTAVVRAQVRRFVRTVVRHTELDDNDDLFAQGFINSLFAMQLVMFVEQTFEVQVDSEDLDMGNFRSIDAVTRFVAKKRRTAPPA